MENYDETRTWNRTLWIGMLSMFRKYQMQGMQAGWFSGTSMVQERGLV